MVMVGITRPAALTTQYIKISPFPCVRWTSRRITHLHPSKFLGALYFPDSIIMGTNITVVEVHPDRTDDEPVLSKASLTLRPAFTRSESTLVALELDEKIVKRSFDANSYNEPAEEDNSEAQRESTEPETGKLSSWNGALILLVSAGAMFMDNVFLTGTNISLSDVQEEFRIQSSELQWLISAYTLSFGGCLLLSGVLSDRYVELLLFAELYTSNFIHLLIVLFTDMAESLC